MENLYIITLGVFIVSVGTMYLIIVMDKKSKEKKRSIPKAPKTYAYHKEVGNSTGNDIYRIGGITTEQFILTLCMYQTLEYAGHRVEELNNKKTQSDYNAEDLFDNLWLVFEAFKDILSLEYVKNGFGTMHYKSVKATYYENHDDLNIEVADMTLRGSLSELTAFYKNPLQNFDMLDSNVASVFVEDYIGEIK